MVVYGSNFPWVRKATVKLFLMIFAFVVVVSTRTAINESPWIRPMPTNNSYFNSYMELLLNKSSHICKFSTKILLNHQTYDHYSNKTFKPQDFLLSIKDKSLSVFGDSVGLQLFQALDVDLQEFEVYAHNGNGTHSSHLFMCNKNKVCGYIEPHNNRHFAAARQYGGFNANILFCSDPSMSESGNVFDFCGKKAMNGDYIIIANSAYYRPVGVDLDVYYQSLFKKEKKLAIDYYRVRRMFLKRNPKTIVIWRTMPHVGPLDQYNARRFNNPTKCCANKLLRSDCCYPHRNGRLWSNSSVIAEWVLRYNEIIRTLAKHFNDQILDWNKLSLHYINYFNEQYAPTHSDSMHWCAGGLPRGANLPLLQSIQRANQLAHQPIATPLVLDDRNELETEFAETVTYSMLPLIPRQRSAGKYVIKRGLWPAWATESYLTKTVFNRSAYVCPEIIFQFFLRHHLERIPDIQPQQPHPPQYAALLPLASTTEPFPPNGFDAKFFLEMIRDKTFAILGDSLGRQIFHALDHDLMHYETRAVRGNGTQTTITYVCKKRLNWCGFVEPLRNREYAAFRYYQQFNATVYFCNDPFLRSPRFQSGGNLEFCGRAAIASDIILLATGPWYKPRGEELNEYRQHMFQREIFFAKSVHLARKNLKAMNPRAKVMWLNIAHVGRIDEYNAMGMNNPDLCCPGRRLLNRDCCYPYKNGLLWSNTSLCAEWVHRFNRIIDVVSSQHGDPLVDWHSLSLQFINYFTPLRVQTHQDSMHWCAGSLNRATNLLIQDAVMSYYSSGKLELKTPST